MRCSFPPEPLVQMIRCLEKRKHCLSPSFFRDREPSRPRVILPFSLMGTCIRDPEKHACVSAAGKARKRRADKYKDWIDICSSQFPRVFVSCSVSVTFPILGSTPGFTGKRVITLGNERVGLVFEHTVLYTD